MASQKLASITASLTRSLLISLLLVRLFYLYKLTSTYSISTSPTPILQTAYIKMAWGGAEEQKREQEAGNAHAKNWCDEALKVVEKTLEEYWNSSSIDTPTGTTTNTFGPLEPDDNSTLESEFDRHRCLLLVQSTNSRAEGWAMRQTLLTGGR